MLRRADIAPTARCCVSSDRRPCRHQVRSPPGAADGVATRAPGRGNRKHVFGDVIGFPLLAVVRLADRQLGLDGSRAEQVLDREIARGVLHVAEARRSLRAGLLMAARIGSRCDRFTRPSLRAGLALRSRHASIPNLRSTTSA